MAKENTTTGLNITREHDQFITTRIWRRNTGNYCVYGVNRVLKGAEYLRHCAGIGTACWRKISACHKVPNRSIIWAACRE
jgi:hypothetical protein